jgi:hypothetical protein
MRLAGGKIQESSPTNLGEPKDLREYFLNPFVLLSGRRSELKFGVSPSPLESLESSV